MVKWVFSLFFGMFLLFLAGCFHIPVSEGGGMDEKVAVRLEADSAAARPGEGLYPRLRVILEYRGQEPTVLAWDSDFGRVLWQGDFVLVSSAGDFRESTAELKFRTSNTYPPDREVRLRKGDRLEAILDFAVLPASFCVNLFDRKGELRLQLFRRVTHEDFSEELTPVSNGLVLRVE